MADFSDYIVYADESGDHGLDRIDQDFPVFCLAFVVVKKTEYIEKLVPAIQRIKFDFWGHDWVVFHEHEIRKQKESFAKAREVRQQNIEVRKREKELKDKEFQKFKEEKIIKKELKLKKKQEMEIKKIEIDNQSSESEEEIIVKKKKSVRKKKIIYVSDEEEEHDKKNVIIINNGEPKQNYPTPRQKPRGLFL